MTELLAGDQLGLTVDAAHAETVTSIRDDGGRATALVADITDDDQCTATVASVLADRERIDVLVNVVGIGGRGDGPAHRAEPEAFQRIIDVNLTAMWRMCRAALPSMRERRRGSIVNVSSAASFAGGFQVDDSGNHGIG